jgi:hypothetical protein
LRSRGKWGQLLPLYPHDCAVSFRGFSVVAVTLKIEIVVEMGVQNPL